MAENMELPGIMIAIVRVNINYLVTIIEAVHGVQM